MTSLLLASNASQLCQVDFELSPLGCGDHSPEHFGVPPMTQFRLRTLILATVAVAVISAVAVFFRPRDLRHEMEEIASASKTFDKLDLVGKYAMSYEVLSLSSDGTYHLTIRGKGGIFVVENGIGH
jgi:hypothetical protein